MNLNNCLILSNAPTNYEMTPTANGFWAFKRILRRGVGGTSYQQTELRFGDSVGLFKVPVGFEPPPSILARGPLGLRRRRPSVPNLSSAIRIMLPGLFTFAGSVLEVAFIADFAAEKA